MKFKARVKNDKLYVKAKISSNEIINGREMEILSKTVIKGFLKPRHVRRNLLEYTGPSGESLKEHLKKPVSKYEFFYIMAQIVEATKKIKNSNLFFNKVVLDIRHIYINSATKEIQFIYMPIEGNHVCVDVIEFMETLIYSMQPEPSQNNDYISKYMVFLKELKGFDSVAIDKYIETEEESLSMMIRRSNRGQSGFITDKPKDYYEHYQQKVEEDNQESDTDCLEPETDYLEEEGTALLNGDSDGTTQLAQNMVQGRMPNLQNVHYATLIKKSSNEKVDLNKPVFRIGRERSYVDYFISNNNAISRSHADIILRNSRYYIYDQNSENHTYLNGKMIPIKTEVEIFDGDELRFANEEFIFRI